MKSRFLSWSWLAALETVCLSSAKHDQEFTGPAGWSATHVNIYKYPDCHIALKVSYSKYGVVDTTYLWWLQYITPWFSRGECSGTVTGLRALICRKYDLYLSDMCLSRFTIGTNANSPTAVLSLFNSDLQNSWEVLAFKGCWCSNASIPPCLQHFWRNGSGAGWWRSQTLGTQ